MKKKFQQKNQGETWMQRNVSLQKLLEIVHVIFKLEIVHVIFMQETSV